METGTDLQQAGYPSPYSYTLPVVGSVMRLRIFEKRGFTRSISADDADPVALFDLKGDILAAPRILQRAGTGERGTGNGERLKTGPTSFLPTSLQLSAITSRKATYGCWLGLVAQKVFLAEVLDGNDIGHRLHHIREGTFHSAEIEHPSR